MRAFHALKRMGTQHQGVYIFLGGDPPLERVEVLIRERPDLFWGDTVVVDLGEDYASIQEAQDLMAGLCEQMSVASMFLLDERDR